MRKFVGSLSIWHWLIVCVVVLIVFGGGKRLSSTMGDLGRGLKIFRKEVIEIGSDDHPVSIENKRMPLDRHSEQVVPPFLKEAKKDSL
ncbi:twin-arginine translocase TatA/TatE family subunit [Gluconobacter kondonii]|uniref:twin-arginine translocase TatA/TatE family subunit n=1 Tax=Gluconobacter kondonii TaxID=941463 RepID=UPI001F11AB21|nr:twin-arginine translocase TatA/TatE family subunit [Gluconobacter kondonii]